MKKLIVVLVILFVFSVSAHAQMGSGVMDEGQMPMMQMMQRCQQMMMGQGMMMRDMMQMMMDMIKMQQRMMRGVGPAERKEMLKEMDRTMERMEKMMSDMRRMMMRGEMGAPQDLQTRLKCAEEWLKKAIDLHELHIKDPKTATESSQLEMMIQMKKAYECVTGIAPEGGMPGKTGQKTQETSEAGVTAKISLERKDSTLEFKVVLDTHTVNLDRYKFAEIVVIRVDGKEYKGKVKSEEGSGHHRSAVIEFENLKTKEVEVVIKSVAGVKERVFKFQL